MQLGSPPEHLVTRFYRAITRYIWYPSKGNPVKRDILFLPHYKGGLGFPNIYIRKHVNRLFCLLRVNNYEEVLSWRRGFHILYDKVAYASVNRLNYIDVPPFFKDLRRAVVKTNFRQSGEFIYMLGKKCHVNKVTTKWMCDVWVEHDFLGNVFNKDMYWENFLGVDARYVRKSWEWAKSPCVDGLARDLHFKLRHHALWTNHRISLFSDQPEFCEICWGYDGSEHREDTAHVFIFCPRAYDFYAFLSPILTRMIDQPQRTITLADLILGLKITPKKYQVGCNFLVQHGQLAIWRSRLNLNQGLGEIDPIEIFKTNVFRNLCRLKTTTIESKFFDIFGKLMRKTNNSVGFVLAF